MKIGIVGLGLIGGSLALEFGDRGHEIWGVSRSPETCKAAIAQGIVSHADTELSSLSEAEFIILCPPIPAILPILEKLTQYLAPEAIVTDAGSVKAAIAAKATEMWPHFVGGHPMAGNTETGLQAARRGLFKGCTYVLTPVEATMQRALDVARSLLETLDVNLLIANPETHDRAVAFISHMPVFVSASAIAACSSITDPATLDLAQKLASSGFRDTSRVGGGNYELGLAMAQFNRNALMRSLRVYRDCLNDCLAWIDSEDWESLQSFLEQQHQHRHDFVE
ncbi:MAG: prephenate/arogenate dehydrogenase [Cyanobacteria bacterium P01_D01_bin.123]